MILDHIMRALTDAMFVSLFYTLPLMLCVTLGFSAETSPMFKRVMTQRKRFAFAFIVTLLSPFMTIWALCETVTNPSMMYRKSFRREVYFTAEGEAMEPVTEVMGRNGLEYINTRGEVVEVSRPATFAYGKFIHPVRLFVPYVEAA